MTDEGWTRGWLVDEAVPKYQPRFYKIENGKRVDGITLSLQPFEKELADKFRDICEAQGQDWRQVLADYMRTCVELGEITRKVTRTYKVKVTLEEE